MYKHVVNGIPLFTTTSKIPEQFQYLTEDIETEVVIVGGGVIGAVLGYYFSKEGISTVIIEKSRVAHGSSCITTALLEYELDDNFTYLFEKELAGEDIIQAYLLGINALKDLSSFISTYGNQCEFSVRDTFVFTTKENEIKVFLDEYNIRKSNGLPVEYFTNENNPFPFEIKAGVYAENGGATLNPFLFTHQLINVGQKFGLQVYENTEATHIEYFEESVEVTTSYNYKIRSKIILIASGYNTSNFTNKIFGSKSTTFNIVTEPNVPLDSWYKLANIRDNEEPYHYLRTTPDNRIIFGGEDCNKQIHQLTMKDKAEHYNKLEKRLKQMFPDVKNASIEYKYCGTFASTNDNLGYFGPDPDEPKRWYSLGYGANGIVFSIIAGMYLPKLFRGEKVEEISIFLPSRRDFT